MVTDLQQKHFTFQNVNNVGNIMSHRMINKMQLTGL